MRLFFKEKLDAYPGIILGIMRFKIINVKNSNSVINFTSPLETLSNKKTRLPFCK